MTSLPGCSDLNIMFTVTVSRVSTLKHSDMKNQLKNTMIERVPGHSGRGSPEGAQAVGRGQVEAALVCLLHVPYVHVDVGDSHSSTLVLGNSQVADTRIYI